MRILTGIDIPFVPFGGSPIICNDWYSNLPPDITVRFLALPPNGPEYQNWWSMKDVVFMDIEKARSAEQFPEYVAKINAEVSRQIALFKPDLIHCQHLNFGFSRAVAELDDCHIPKLGICHGTDVQIAKRDETGFFLSNMQFIVDRMNLLLFPSQNMLNDYLKHGGQKRDYVVVPHGIPDKAYMRRWTKRSAKGECFKVLFAGRLSAFKGPDLVVSAMRYVPENIHLTLIGNEDDAGYQSTMLQEVDRYDLHERVAFRKHIPREQLWTEFSNFDLIVFPSTELECFCLTTVEAQARGLVVAYHQNAGGIENAVGGSGIRVWENTPETWASVIRMVYHNPQLLDWYRRLGYVNAERHRLGLVRERFFDVSRRLAAAHSSPPELGYHRTQAAEGRAHRHALDRYYTQLWEDSEQTWRTGRVTALNMQDGVSVPLDYCLSTIARLERQDQSPVAAIEAIIEGLRKVANGQFFYPRESIHITLLGCTPRMPSPEDFSLERIARVREVCARVIRGAGPVKMTIRGLNIVGSQIFAQAYPHDGRWAGLRRELELSLRAIHEEPLARSDKTPVHMNLMRVTNNDPDQLSQLLGVVRDLHDRPIGEMRVSLVEYLITDFVVSQRHAKVIDYFSLR